MAGLKWSFPGTNKQKPTGQGDHGNKDAHAYSLDGPVVYEQRRVNGEYVVHWVGPGEPEEVYRGPGDPYPHIALKNGHWQRVGQGIYDAAQGAWRQPVSEEQEDVTLAPPSESETLQRLIDETLWSRIDVLEVVDTLRSRRPQIILAGPPGTGKTWVAERFARYLADNQPDAVHLVQFHPSYAYEDFVEGLRPVAAEGQVAFEVVAGALIRIADIAREVEHPVVLVIDEINRANLPSVFGELLYLLEYRDREIRLLHRDRFSLPENLYLIGTMNTADRSIRSVDAALRRRFDIFDCPARQDVLDAYYDRPGNSCAIPGLSAGLRKLNEQLTEHIDRHHTIGHTFLMAENFTRDELRRTWYRQIRPLIDEYFFDQPDLVDQFELDAFWPGQSDW